MSNPAATPSSRIVFEGAGSGLSETEQTDNLVTLFSTTLHSLAADAAAIRQATSLAHCLGITTDHLHSTDDNDKNDKNVGVVNDEIANGLWDLDDLVKSLEDKVSALRQIVVEEKRALVKMEMTLQPEADMQVMLLEQLLQAMEQQGMTTMETVPIIAPQRMQHRVRSTGDDEVTYGSNDVFDGADVNDDDENCSTTSDNSSSSHPKRNSSGRLRGGGSRRDSVDPRRAKNNDATTNSTKSLLLSSSSSFDGGGENYDPSVVSIALRRITPQELEDLKVENTLGPRISTSLIDLNEALDEIEQLCQRQRHAALNLKRKQQQQLLQGNASGSGSGSTSNATAGSVHRRYQYLQKRQQLQHGTSTTTPLMDDGTCDEPDAITITEQELRENCPFFRHGESTARATLSLLCRLKRLKQVPNKNRNVTYHLLL